MNNLATLAAGAVHHLHHGHSAPAAEPLVSPAVRKLFILLHGSYGSLFISKFSTGEKDAKGHDKGIRAAMKVWESKLQRFPNDVLETAADRLTAEHPEFPPNLPQFEALCVAVMPRPTYAEENNLVRLPPPVVAPVELVGFEPRGDDKDWARRLLARHDAGEVLKPIQLRFAREALGLPVKPARVAA